MHDEAKLGTSEHAIVFSPAIPGVVAYRATEILKENGIEEPVVDYTVSISDKALDNLLHEAADIIAKTGLSREKVQERLDTIGWQHES